MSELELTHSLRVDEWDPVGAPVRDFLEQRAVVLEPARKVDVWVAQGLRLRYRVVSLGHTYGEWDSLADATRFLHLLVDGNPDLAVLR